MQQQQLSRKEALYAGDNTEEGLSGSLDETSGGINETKVVELIETKMAELIAEKKLLVQVDNEHVHEVPQPEPEDTGSEAVPATEPEMPTSNADAAVGPVGGQNTHTQSTRIISNAAFEETLGTDETAPLL